MLQRGALFTYGLFAVPLAFIGLAIYGFVPKLYADHYGVSLAVLSLVVFITRAVDVVQMPFIGWYSDQQNLRPRSRHQRIFTLVPLLVLSVYALFHPTGYPAVWMGVSLVLVQGFYSVIVTHYFSLGAELTKEYHDRTRIAATREICALLGMLLAALMPFVFTTIAARNDAMSIGFGVMLVLTLALFYFSTPSAEPHAAKLTSLSEGFERIASNNAALMLMLVVLLNGIAIALPVSSFVFFVDDALNAAEHTPYFILTFFSAAVAMMPVWSAVAKRKGKRVSWLWAMSLGAVALLAMSQIHEGNVILFYMLCACAGACIGADFALPTALLADIIPPQERAGYYTGCFLFIAKLSLALAGGACLWLLGASMQVSFVYALLPACIKILAVIVLGMSALDRR